MDDIDNYKTLNAEMSKTIVTLKSEIKRLKDENQKMIIDSLRTQNQVIKLKKQLADSHVMQVNHVNVLTMELQSFVCKMNEIAVNNNKSNRIGEQSLTNVSANNSSRRMSRSYESPGQRRRSASRIHEEENGLPNIAEEVEENDEADSTQNTTHSILTSQCQSTIANLNSIKNSLINSVASTSNQSDDSSASRIHEEENGSPNIAEEIEENDEADSTQNTTHSILTSQCQSTIANVNSIKNSLINSVASTSNQSDDSSGTNSQSIVPNSNDSDKENQSVQSSKELNQIEYFGALSPLKNFVSNRRKKHDVINQSIENIELSGVVSSTPYKQTVKQTDIKPWPSTILSESDVDETKTEVTFVANTRSKRIRKSTTSFSVLSSNSITNGTETKETEICPSKTTKDTGKIFTTRSNSSSEFNTETVPMELANTRPKRKASQGVIFIEPKLNTKLRRPMSMERKVSAKPKRARN